jgi:hypothetical protein
LHLRAENLTSSGDEKEVVLKGEGAVTLEWRSRITEQQTPWLAVVVPDGDLSQRRGNHGRDVEVNRNRGARFSVQPWASAHGRTAN